MPSAVELLHIETLENFSPTTFSDIVRTDSPDAVDTGFAIRFGNYSDNDACAEASNISVQLMSTLAPQASNYVPFAILYTLSGMLTTLGKLEGIGRRSSARYSSRRYRELALVIWYLLLSTLNGAWLHLPRAIRNIPLAALYCLLVMLLPDNWPLEGIGQAKQSSELYLLHPTASIFQDLQSLRMRYFLDVHHRE